MILDTFEILFSTSAKKAREEVVALDKELADLEKKGKKRSDEENKHYQELTKRRKEALDEIKQQQRETDKLGDSFQNMATNAIGALTAFATFQGLKNTLKDANNLNLSLAQAEKLYGLNGKQVREYSSALASLGGNAQAFEQYFIGLAAQRKAQYLAPPNVAEIINSARTPLGQQQAAAIGLSSVAGPLIFSDPNQIQQALATGKQRAASFTPEAQKAALANQGAIGSVEQALQDVATQINTSFSWAVKQFSEGVQSFIGIFNGHPGLALSEWGLLIGGGGLAAKKALGKAFGLFRGAAPAGAGEAVAGAEAAGGIGLAGLAGIIGAGAAIGTTAWYLLGKEQDFINRTFGKRGVSGNPSGSSRDRILSFWKQRGYSTGAAAGWTANAQAESSFNPLASNGSHFGIYQWSAERRAAILKGTGIDVASASLDKQLEAAAWEAGHMGLGPGQVPNDPRAAAALISNRYEVPSLTASGLAAEAARRGQIAAGYGLPLASSDAGLAASGKTVSVKTGDIIINTQATDAQGVAAAVSGELKNQIRLAMSNLDDGVNY